MADSSCECYKPILIRDQAWTGGAVERWSGFYGEAATLGSAAERRRTKFELKCTMPDADNIFIIRPIAALRQTGMAMYKQFVVFILPPQRGLRVVFGSGIKGQDRYSWCGGQSRASSVLRGCGGTSRSTGGIYGFPVYSIQCS